MMTGRDEERGKKGCWVELSAKFYEVGRSLSDRKTGETRGTCSRPAIEEAGEGGFAGQPIWSRRALRSASWVATPRTGSGRTVRKPR